MLAFTLQRFRIGFLFISVLFPAASRRRTNVVKEVEKLKKNREERRIRQAEIKTEKENLMNLDPGNPNWEFLSMIREYRQNLEIKPLRETDAVEDHQITVCVRKRPMNKKGDNIPHSDRLRRAAVFVVSSLVFIFSRNVTEGGGCNNSSK